MGGRCVLELELERVARVVIARPGVLVRRWSSAVAMGTVVAAATLVPTRGDAQVRRDTTARRDTVRAPGDTIRAPGDTTGARRDSLRADSTAKLKVEWAQPDSVMSELISREGYTATKYQGERVDLRAKDRTIKLEGKAAVGRPDAVLVGDTVVYNDSLDIVTATSKDTTQVVLQDPTGAQDEHPRAPHRVQHRDASRQGVRGDDVREQRPGVGRTRQSHGLPERHIGGEAQRLLREGRLAHRDVPTAHRIITSRRRR